MPPSAAPARTTRPPADPWRVHRTVFALLLLSLALVQAVRAYALVIAGGGGHHQTADWLIGYAAGPGRRGLFGELFLRLAPPGQPGLWSLLAIQVGLYVVVVAYLVLHLVRTRFSWAAIALVLGPAALAFAGWDPQGAFRKEVLIFVALALLGWARHAGRFRARQLLVWSGVAAFAFAAFSWEAAYAALPVGVWLVLNPGGSRLPGRQAVAAASTLVAAGLAAVALGLATPGDAATAAALCDAVRAHGHDAPMLCSGAIGWMGNDTGDGVWQVGFYFPGSLRFLPLAALALLGVLTTSWARRHSGVVLATVVALAPLFAIALDWGRWIHMVVMFVAIAVASDPPDRHDGPRWTGPGALAYVTAWALPHSLGSAAAGGAVGAVTAALVALGTALAG